MDTTLLGSIIEASATLVGILIAVWVARRELELTRDELRLTKEAIKLATYENFGMVQ